jgi:MFS family permease
LDPRYLIVASAFSIQGLIIGSMFAYGVFFPALEAEFGWSRTTLSSSISAAVVVMGLLAIPGGHLIDRFGPRWVLTATGFISGIGYVLTAELSMPWQLFVFFGVFVGIGMSTHDVGTLSVVARLFVRRRGLMIGVVKVGTAAGQMVIPLVATALIASLGWRDAASIIGISLCVLLAIVAQGMRPERITAPAQGDGPAAPPSGSTLRQATRTRAFWILCVAQFCFLPALVTIPVHLPVHGNDLGLSATAAAALLAVIGGASIAGRLGIGRIVDGLDGRRAMLICFTLLGLSLAALPSLHETWMLYAFTFVYGFAHGGLFTVVAPTIAEYFGMRSHGAIFGAVVLSGTAGAAMGPLAAGQVFDRLGSYGPAFYGLAVLAAVGLVMVACLPTADKSGQ